MQSKQVHWRDFCDSVFFGTISGTTCCVLFQPLDRVKTVMQDPSLSRRPSLLFTCRLVFRSQGPMGFWRGLGPSLFRSVPGVSLYFGSLELIRLYFFDNRTPSAGQNLITGIFARSFVATLLMPTTVLKTRFESTHYRDKGIRYAIQDLHKQRGLRGFYSGMTPTIVRDGFTSGLYLMFYRKELTLLPNDVLDSSSSSIFRFGCGILAGIIASAITHPFDSIKTHMQLFPNKYRSLFVASSLLYKQFGPSVFAIGFLPRSMRRAVITALQWTLFDEMVQHASEK